MQDMITWCDTKRNVAQTGKIPNVLRLFILDPIRLLKAIAFSLSASAPRTAHTPNSSLINPRRNQKDDAL
jgi:hypothetical protein